MPGCELEGIHYLRTLGNADAIRADAADAEQVVLIGGSYIGCEVAASLTLLGKRCTIVMQEQITLERGFGPASGRFFQELLESHGVTVHGQDELERFEGDGRVAKVVTKNGLELPAELVVIGAGVAPDVQLARGAGLELGEGGGVRCSSRLATSAPGVFAAGDICEYDSPCTAGPLRIEHWDVAFNHGKTAALNMLGRDIPHETVPYFYSVLGDWGELEYVGPAREWDEEIVRGVAGGGQLHHVVPARRAPRRGAHLRPLRRPRPRAPAARRATRRSTPPPVRRWRTLTASWGRSGGSAGARRSNHWHDVRP